MPGGGLFFIRMQFGVQVGMGDASALSVGYAVRYTTDPGGGVKTLDQVTTVNVVDNIN
jgi:putative salt-induced outer membrane protein YdiY